MSYADSVAYIGQKVLRLFTIEETPSFPPAGASPLVTYLLHHPYCRHHGLKHASTIYRASLAFAPSFSLLHQEPPAATKNSTRICRHSHLALQRRMGETRFCTTRGKELLISMSFLCCHQFSKVHVKEAESHLVYHRSLPNTLDKATWQHPYFPWQKNT